MKRLAFLISILLILPLSFSTVSISLSEIAQAKTSPTTPDTSIIRTIYYLDVDGNQQVVDNSWEAATAPWDWQMLNAGYHVKVKEDFTAGQIIEFEVKGEAIQFQPMALEWTNDLNQIQPITMPNDIVPAIGHEQVELLPGVINNMGWIRWDDSYGDEIDFEWKCTPSVLSKVLEIESLNKLSIPEPFIVNGGNPVLRLNLIFDPSTAVEIYIDDVLWDKKTKKQTFSVVEFRKEGEVLWNFMPLMYWGSNPELEENEGQSIATLEKRGNKLYISIRVPYEWLQSAVYPVFVDADVTIDAFVYTGTHEASGRGGVFWTTTLIGYVIYIDSDSTLVYSKTVDGGATWGAANLLVNGVITAFDCWADWQTEGDAGTKIHIACIVLVSNVVSYVYLDTSDDSEGIDTVEACQGSGVFKGFGGRSTFHISITKTRGGNIALAVRYLDNLSAAFYMFYTSPDGDTWTSGAIPWETAADLIQLYPANLADNQDLWAAFWDVSADEISLKTYDDSGDSWSEQSIAGSMADSTTYIQMDGAIRLSDGHLILAAWSQFDNAASDLMVWDINGAGSITAKTNVITDEAETFLVSVFINQNTDDIYVAYVSGSAAGALVAAFYQKSDDGAGTWGGETAMQANAEDDERWISCGAVKAAWGGKFQPVWFNDDLNDLFTNTDNGISIAAAGGVVLPTVTTQAATNVEDTTATGNGNITNTGGENCDVRGIVWDLATHGDPGNVAPGASDYANDVSEAGSFGTGAFTRNLTGLPTGDTIYARAYAHNSAGYAYGAEVNFLTKPAAPTNVSATDGTDTAKVVITWTKSTGATDYHVWRDAVDLGAAGDVATFDDAGADAPTITPGNAVATDGSETAHISLSLAGASANNGTTHTYKVVASNGSGDSDDSLTDGGYRDVGALTYQWQRSAADADADYGNIGGATASTYDDNAAPAGSITPGDAVASDGSSSDYVALSMSGQSTIDGAGRYYQCILNATGAAQQTSASNRGYRGVGAITYQWQRSAADSDADYGNIAGATTENYNDTGAPANSEGRYYRSIEDAAGAAQEISGVNRGFRAEPGEVPVSIPSDATKTTLIFGQLVLVGAVGGVAFWRRDLFFYLICCPILITFGLQWYDFYHNASGLAMSLVLIALGIYSMILAIVNLLKRQTNEKLA